MAKKAGGMKKKQDRNPPPQQYQPPPCDPQKSFGPQIPEGTGPSQRPEENQGWAAGQALVGKYWAGEKNQGGG